MSAHASTQKNQQAENQISKKRAANRNRIPFHITLSPETIETLRKKTKNASQFIEESS